MILWRTDGNQGKTLLLYCIFVKFYEYGEVHVMGIQASYTEQGMFFRGKDHSAANNISGLV